MRLILPDQEATDKMDREKLKKPFPFRESYTRGFPNRCTQSSPEELEEAGSVRVILKPGALK